MVTLEYYNGKEWTFVHKYPNEIIAWMTLGSDNYNYRVVNEAGEVLKINTKF